MDIEMDIDVHLLQAAEAPTITVAELKRKIQEYVNGLYVRVILPKEESATAHQHSLSSLRGICKSGMTDSQALNEHLSEKY